MVFFTSSEFNSWWASASESITPAPNSIKGSLFQENGKSYAAHMTLPPGKRQFVTDVTHYMNLPYDTALHAAGMHLHPFAQAVTLRDATDGRVIFKVAAKTIPDPPSIERIDSFLSPEGVPLFKDHRYEIVADYDNTGDKDADAMADAILYFRDQHFDPKAFLK